MHVTEWKEPALLWNGNVSALGRPRILEIRSDQFVPVFLQAMLGTDPAAYLLQRQIDAVYNPQQPIKLYQPLHGCYYLVTASLVCRQIGLPDKTINRADGESVAFVVRRLTPQGEEAWIPAGQSGFWQHVANKQTLAPGEERFPMHPVTVCAKPATPRSVFTDNIERDLHYGYIVTGNRDKYKDTVARTTPTATSPTTLVNDFLNQAEADAQTAGIDYSFRADLFQRRVYEPWVQLTETALPASAPTSGVGLTATEEQQLYSLLELGDFLKNNLPTLWDALLNHVATGLVGDMAALFELLEETLTVTRTAAGVEEDISVSMALSELEPYFDLVRGQGEFPTNRYEIGGIGKTNLATLLALVKGAVKLETQPIRIPAGEDAELVRLIRDQVQTQPTAEPVYVIRTVYEYDPECPPAISLMHSQPFRLAKFFDPDAPARLVRLEAPSIKPKDLRKYARGVGIEMSPELHKLTSSLAGKDAQKVIDSIGNGGISIQMICTFSIQIIFLVAFIVMFIFLIVLNFIFWWLAFLRICLPIPKKA